MIYLQIFLMILLGMGSILLMVYLVDRITNICIVNELFTVLLSTFTIVLCIAGLIFLELFLYQRWF